MQNRTCIILILIALILGLTVGYFSNTSTAKVQSRTDTIYTTVEIDRIKLDTVHLVRFLLRKDTIKEYFPEYITKIDSFYCVKPFVACYDTITTNKDTVQFKYLFPELLITDLRVSPHAITIPIVTKTMIKQRPLWLDITTHTGAFLLGFLLRGI